jgi:hypothetical protein
VHKASSRRLPNSATCVIRCQILSQYAWIAGSLRSAWGCQKRVLRLNQLHHREGPYVHKKNGKDCKMHVGSNQRRYHPPNGGTNLWRCADGGRDVSPDAACFPLSITNGAAQVTPSKPSSNFYFTLRTVARTGEKAKAKNQQRYQRGQQPTEIRRHDCSPSPTISTIGRPTLARRATSCTGQHSLNEEHPSRHEPSIELTDRN